MRRGLVITLFLPPLLLLLCPPLLCSEPESPWVLTTDTLPSDTSQSKFNPSLSNGELAVTAYLRPGPSVSPSIFVNCLYSGQAWRSHRARLPNYSNYLLRLQPQQGGELWPEYRLDLARAKFEASFTSPEFWVSHELLVHRTFTSTILNIVTAGPATPSQSSLQIDIDLEVGEQSDDITNTGTTEMEVRENQLGIERLWYRCEETTNLEFSSYQPQPSPVCIAWVEPWFSSISLTGNDLSSQQRVFITIVESSLENILAELELVLDHSLAELLSLHYSAMSSLWSSGLVEVSGDLELSRVLLSSQFYLLSSLPSPQPARPRPQFCGLSPGSLARGLEGQDYQGHSFWDTETWMFPPVLLLHPNIARSLLEYRWARLSQAEDYAASSGWEGARFPWESAFTGEENCQFTFY